MKKHTLSCLLALSMMAGAVSMPVYANEDVPNESIEESGPTNPLYPDEDGSTTPPGDEELSPETPGDQTPDAQPEGTPQAQSGKITVKLPALSDGAAGSLEGVEFTLVKAASIVDGEYVYNAPFAQSEAAQKIDINNLENSEALRNAAFVLMNVYTGAKQNPVSPDDKDVTDSALDAKGDAELKNALTEMTEAQYSEQSIKDLIQAFSDKIAASGYVTPSRLSALKDTLLKEADNLLKQMGLSEPALKEALLKVTSALETAIKNAQDQITDEAGDGESYKAVTDASGIAQFSNLPVGVYLLYASNLASYELIVPTLLAVPTWSDSEAGMMYELEVEPKTSPLPEIKIIKTDSTTKQPITGKQFEFGLYSDKECKNLISKQTDPSTDGDAQFQIRYGTFYIKEISAPEGYKLSDKVIEVVFDANGVSIDGKTEEADITGLYADQARVYTVEYENTPETTPQKQQTTFNTGIRGYTGWIIGGIAVCLIGLFAAIYAKRRTE